MILEQCAAASTRPPRLWSTTDRAVVWLSLALGALLWASGWWASSGTADVDETVFGVVMGVAAVGAVATASLMWIATGRQAVRARHRALTNLIDQLFEGMSVPPTATDVLVALPGSSRAHLPDCLLVRGKDVTTLSSNATRLRDRVPCEMCRP